MAKLSQQAQPLTSQTPTRTERVMQKQSIQRFQREKANFESRKKQAEEIRQSKFSEIQSVEDYGKKYETLDPQLKEFFLTPTDVKQHQVTELENTKTKIADRIIVAQEKKAEVTKRYEDKIKKAEESWYKKSSKYRHDENRKERYKKKLNDYEDTQEEKEIYWEWYIRKIQEGQSQLNAGKNISYSDLDSFADNYGSYKQDKKEASNENRAFKKREQRKIEDLRQAGYETQVIEKSFKGKPTSIELTAYHPETKDWQKIKEFKAGDSYDVSGLKKLGYSAPQTRTISYAGKDFKFKSRVPLFVTPKTKDIVTPYGKTGLNEEVLIKEAQEKYDTEQKARAKEFLKQEKFTETETTKPIITEDKNLWQKIWGGIKTGYTATTFGRGVKMPEKYDIERKTGFSQALHLLTLKEASEGLAYEERKATEQKKQIELITKYEKAVEKAPEDLKYYVQQEGLDVLGARKTGEFYLTPVVTAEGISFKSNALTESESFIEREMVKVYEKAPTIDGKKKMTLERGLLYTSYASQKFIEAYGVGKLIGGTISYGTKAVKGIHTALGGGLKLADATHVTIKGGKTAGVLWKPKVYSTIGKTTILSGMGGAYVYSKIKSYRQITDKYGKAGKGMFWSGTVGEIAGFGALTGGGAITKYQAKKFNEQQLKINYLKTQKAKELKLIKTQVNILGKGIKSYKQIGLGKTLSSQQQTQLSGIYARVTGLSKKQSLSIIREKALYKQTLKIKSIAPSIDRQIKYLQTGKVAIGKGELIFKRYGISETIKTPKGAKTLAIEFDKRGNILTKIGVKTTVGADKYAITKVFEQAKYSPKLDMKGFRLKKIISAKASKIKQAEKGEVKIDAFDIESRLLKQYHEKEFLKQTRKPFSEIKFKKGDVDSAVLKKLYKIVGEEAKISHFKNIRLQAQSYNRMGIGREGDFISLQAGAGKGDIPTLIGKMKYTALKEKIWTMPQSRIPRGTSFTKTFTDDILKSKITDVVKIKGKQPLKQVEDLRLDPRILTESASQSASQINIKTKTILKKIIKDKSAQTLSSISTVASASSVKVAVAQKTKTKSDIALKDKVLSKLDISLKSDLLLQTKVLQQTKTIQKLTQPTITTPNIREISMGIRTPIISTPTYIPPVIPLFFLKGKIKKKLKKKEGKFSEFAYLPDFTARAIGLKPEIISGKQAQAKIKKILTGLEIRRGVKIK